MRLRVIIAITALLMPVNLCALGQTTDAGPFRVGAAKVDTTPTPDDLPRGLIRTGLRSISSSVF